MVCLVGLSKVSASTSLKAGGLSTTSIYVCSPEREGCVAILECCQAHCDLRGLRTHMTHETLLAKRALLGVPGVSIPDGQQRGPLTQQADRGHGHGTDDGKRRQYYSLKHLCKHTRNGRMGVKESREYDMLEENKDTACLSLADPVYHNSVCAYMSGTTWPVQV